MVITIGPVCPLSAEHWTGYAQTVLTQVVTGHGALGDVDDAVLVAFQELLDEWRALAASGSEFRWSTEIDPDSFVVLATTFHDVAQQLTRAAEERGYPASPPEGEAFYLALVNGLLDALGQAGGEAAALGAGLRATWPGLESV